MEYIRQIRRVEGNSLTVYLPEIYRSKDIEVIILPLEEKEESISVQPRLFESLKYISIDTRNFKLNRDELHER